MTDSTKTDPETHAIITPWSLSVGPIVTWCGALAHGTRGRRGARRLPAGALVTSERPTCPNCVDAMQTARDTIGRALEVAS